MDCLWVLKVHRGEPNNRQRRVDRIEANIEKLVVDYDAREEREDTIHVDGHRLEDIFVKHVSDGVRVAPVSLSPVEEQQVLQESELAD